MIDKRMQANNAGASAPAPALGVTVMPEWFQHEGIEPVLDRVEALGARAIATSPYVMERCADGEGGREPPGDGDAGKVRPLERDLFGARELHVRTAPSFEHDPARYRDLRYHPSPATALTRRYRRLLDDVCSSAARRNIAVYLQVMAASPPGYRVQFSGAAPADLCLLPDGRPHPDRVDRNASLASPHVVAYIAALVAELAKRYPGVTGLRLDWPEYPPYDFRSALFDFNPALVARLAAAGHAPATTAQAVSTWAADLRTAAAGAASDGPQAVVTALQGAGWEALFDHAGPLAPLYAAKRGAARDLLAACRTALDGVPGPRRRLEPQAFPPPLSAISGFPMAALHGIADAVGVKLYTMHWPMLARYWARDLAGAVPEASLDAVTAAVAWLLGFTDVLVEDGASLRYPEPHVAHPVGTKAQRAKLQAARDVAGSVPVIAFVHAYGPVDDVVRRRDIAAAGGTPLWINRYGYLSDEKIAALALPRVPRPPQALSPPSNAA